jgi:hypothetical protein
MAQAKGGRRYALVVYTRMMDRWGPAVLALGIGLLALAWGVRSWGYEDWRWLAFASIGGLNIFLGIALLILRRSAYVQPFSDHLRIVTPFLRLNISYRRIRRTSMTSMGALFPRQSVSAWRAEIIEPLAKMTAMVIDLNGYPMSQSTLRMFLSPLFFKDKTPHLVILVNDWMKFSAELDGMRAGGGAVAAQKPKSAPNSILSRLPTKDK